MRAGRLSPQAAALELNLHPSRIYQLRTDYLRACAQGRADTWSPGRSGGDHHPDWPAPVTALLTTLLSSDPASSYSACASELHRRLDFKTGARLYESENLLAHLDFLPRVFQAKGLPLALDVDCHSFYFTQVPDAFTQLGAALHFSGVALRYAPTPQAKGKIERRHDYWQKRLPPLLAADRIHELAGANALLDQLLPHANQHELHRELGLPPQAAWDQAQAERRSVLRPAPACPWWPYVWSVRTRVRVGDDGQVPVGSQRHSIDAPPRPTVNRCLRPDGDVFYLRHAPNPTTKPLVLLHCPVF